MSAGSYGAEASTAPAALMDCWTFMCTVCNVCRSDGGDQLVKVNRVEQTNKSVRLTEVVRALPVPTILHAPHVTAPLRDVWSARPGDGKDRMLHDEAFRSFSSMYVLGLCNRRRCLGVCWGRESSRELKVPASAASPSVPHPPLYVSELRLLEYAVLGIGLLHAQVSNDSSLFTSRALQSLPMRPARSQHHVLNVE